MIAVVLIVIGVIALTVAAIAGASVRVLREYERGVVFRLGRVIEQKGPGLVLLIPAVDRLVREPAHRGVAHPPSGGDHPRQRAGARSGGGLLPRDRSAPIGDRGRGLQGRDPSDRSDHVALRARQGRPRRTALRARAPEREPQQIIDEQTEPWGSRSRSSRSRTWRSQSGCSRRWPAKPRPSATGAPRS